MRYTMERVGMAFQVIDSTTNEVVFAGSAIEAAIARSRFELASMSEVAAAAGARKAIRREAAERGQHGGYGISRSGRRS